MDTATLIAKALEQREQWLDLAPGKRVKLRRPAAAEMFAIGRAATPETFLRRAVDWDGFREADILGSAVGSDAVVKFDLELWLVLALDEPDWMAKVSDAVVASITQYLEARDAATKN